MRVRSDEDEMLECSACGSLQPRGSGDLCSVCGKTAGEDYRPLDMIRSSYRLQRRQLTREPQPALSEKLFETADDPIADIAWAGLVYSFVPYLGILFTPVALIVGSLDLVRSARRGEIKRPLRGMAIAVVVGTIQIFLWYLLYEVPKLGRTI